MGLELRGDGICLIFAKKKIMERIPEALAEFFEHRATVRKYTDEAPGRELIDSILKAAMRAPTTGNMQLYSVIETRDAEMRRKLAALHFNQPAAAGHTPASTISCRLPPRCSTR